MSKFGKTAFITFVGMTASFVTEHIINIIEKRKQDKSGELLINNSNTKKKSL